MIEWLRVEARDNWRHEIDRGSRRGGHIPHPAVFPPFGWYGVKGVQHVCRSERDHARFVWTPAAIQKHPAFAAEACMNIGPAKVRPHNFIWHRGIPNAHMGNLPLRKRLVFLGAQNGLARIGPDDVRFR